MAHTEHSPLLTGAFGSQAAIRLRAALLRSGHPMLLADDQRRWITGNTAAAELLGVDHREIPWRAMDDFTPAEDITRLGEQWAEFMEHGAAEGWHSLSIPGRGVVPVEFSAIANVLPSRHLTVLIPPDDASVARAELSDALATSWAPATLRPEARAALTKREREVMTLVAAGGQSPDIARELFLSAETVKSHVTNAMGKLGARTRAHAVAIALTTGEIIWPLFEGDGAAPRSDERPI